jgi:isopropylmalate/homocitrate/citramalate synthase
MKNKIKILDCTLRDGGYVNNWEFSNESIINIIKSLLNARIDIIECGFVSQKKGVENDSSTFKSIEQGNKILEEIQPDLSKNEFCVMINYGDYDLETLPVFNPKKDFIGGIRLAFHKKDWKDAIEKSKIIIDKGYKLFIQAMVTLSYTDSEILEMLQGFNKLDIYAMYIVDSFGAMLGSDFKRLHYLFDNNLNDSVMLGYHSHNNLQLAYSNAINYIDIKNSLRKIIIDSSIHGMGRGAGNLNTELLADYLNKKKHTNYNIIPLLETIDNYLEAIYRENYWGYSIAHFLSASVGCHPNYATFLVNKKTLSIVDMQKILSELDKVKKKSYNEEYVSKIYIDYKSEIRLKENIQKDFFTGKNILIIASGPNASRQKDVVFDYIKINNPIIITLNHISQYYDSQYYFFSNQKRFDKFSKDINKDLIIVTSNIKVNSLCKNCKVADYHNLVSMTSNKNDNVTIMLMNLLIKQGVGEVSIAGFDGYKFDSINYSYLEYDRIIDKVELEKQNQNIIISLKEISPEIKINFITDSIYKV